jgi:hypothetical protein
MQFEEEERRKRAAWADVDLPRQRTVSNLMYAYARTVDGGDIETYGRDVERLEEAVRSGTLPWETAPIVVDHVQTSSESLNLGSNFWIAVGQLADRILSLKSHGVSKDQVALIRTTRHNTGTT